MTETTKPASAAVPGFDASVAGKRAECDGGGPIQGTRYAGREEFAGTLTGDFVDHGDPPWRWYLLGDLVKKPESYTDAVVWCESGSVFLVDEPDRVPGKNRL